MDEYGNYFEDPRYSGSQGSWITTNADAGAQFVPLSVTAPMGQYVTTNADAGGQYVENTPEQRAAINAQLQAERQAQLQGAAAYVAGNPLRVSGDQIATRYGDRNLEMFRPIAQPGQSVSGSTPTQMVDPSSGMPVFLSNPNDPFSYTYSNTGTPAVGGTLEQQAALYRPMQTNGVFGTLGGDLLDAVKDPYFRNFALAAATMAAAAAIAPAAGAGGLGSAGTGATAFPVDFSSTITTGGLGGGASAGAGAGTGSLGALSAEQASNLMLYDILPASAQTPANISSLSGLMQSGKELLGGPYGSLIKGGISLGGSAVANALKSQNTSTGQSGLTSEQLQAMVAGMPSMVGQYTAQAQNGMGQNYTGYNAPATIADLFPAYSLASAQMPTVGSTNAPVYGAGRFAPLI